MAFSKAGRAEILRANQKDEILCESVRSHLIEMLLRVCGSRWVCTYSNWISIGTRHLYYALTTLSNLQTLGEEYTGIIMVNNTKRYIPSKTVRLIMIAAHCAGLELLSFTLKKIKKYVEELPTSKGADEEACQKLSNFILLMEKSLPLLIKIHTAVFYLEGVFLSFSKRLTGIHYILHHHWIKDHSTENVFKVVFVSSIIALLLESYEICRKLSYKHSQLLEEPECPDIIENVRGQKCSLCLELLSSPSATTCGHIFCWSCILEWLKSEQLCPVCKDEVSSSRVILLKNYT